MNKWVIGLIIVVLAVLGWYWKVSKKPANPEGTIKIGAVLGLTGAASNDSLNVKRGLDLAREDLAKKGIDVEISYQDDKTDPKQTVSAIQYLAANVKPQAIVGPIWSFLEEAGAPIAASHKIITYAPADTSEFVSGGTQFNFRGAPLNARMEEPLTEWLKANNKKRVAIITSKDGWGVSVLKPFEAAAKNAGAEIVVNEAIQSFSPDAATAASTIMTKIKAAKADVILWTGYEQDAVTIARKREDLKLNIPLVDAGTIYQALVLRGTISYSQTKDAYFIAVPTSSGFIEKFQQRYGEVPGSYADRAYDGLMILVESIRNAQPNEPEAVAKYMRDIRYQGYGGLYEFNENGDVKSGTWVIQPVM